MSTFNIGNFITQNARRFPNQPGVIEGDQILTWHEINARINKLASALSRHGVHASDVVLVQARNSFRAFECKWACFKLGAIWVPVNFRLTPAEVGFLAEHSGSKAMMFDSEFAEHHRHALDQTATLMLSICLDAAVSNAFAYEELVATGNEKFCAAEVHRDQPAWFFYTSGTTGRPKAAVLTHGQLAFVVTSHLADMFPATTENDVSLVLAPISHGAGVHALAHVARGAPQIFLSSRSLEPELVWRTIERYRVTNFFCVPTLLKSIIEHPAVDRHDHSSLRFVNYGGAPMYRPDQRNALKKLGKVLIQHYGLGEFTANITFLPPDMHELDSEFLDGQIGTCGRARTGIEIAILDADGRRLSPYEVGEIVAKGQAAFLGYHNDAEATAKAFAGGWFHTGDLGYLDQQGFLFITGRSSDMYISGGLNVYPREVEEVLLRDGRIEQAAVVGVPHPKWGECGIAVIVPKTGRSICADDVMALLTDEVARYKHPKEVHFWPDLPMSGYGKILKREIIAKLLAENNSMLTTSLRN